MSRILVVEDEQHLADGLRFNLEAEGHQVETVETGEAALEKLTGTHGFELVVLDVMLPGKDGFAVCLELREAGQFVPILMLTARGRPEDVLKGFAAGADDYLAKPFELAILIARIGGLLRRHRWLRKAEPDRPRVSQAEIRPDQVEADVFAFNGKIIDFNTLELKMGERSVRLTLMETNLLRYLIRHQGKAVSRKSMLEEVWGVREDTDTRAIDNFIVRLRKYIEPEPARPRHLLTVRGVGYRFIPKPD
jgi:DNA-binding response OmpR family regulator